MQSSTEVRKCLKLINFYIRDVEMSATLRTMLLTRAAKTPPVEEKHLWRGTHALLKRSFGIGEEIDARSNWFLEVYKNVEAKNEIGQNKFPKKYKKKVENLREEVNQEFT